MDREELQRAQDNLDKLEVEGAAGGGLVKVRASAKGRILGVSIDDSLLAPSEKQMLEDLITAAPERGSEPGPPGRAGCATHLLFLSSTCKAKL